MGVASASRERRSHDECSGDRVPYETRVGVGVLAHRERIDGEVGVGR